MIRCDTCVFWEPTAERLKDRGECRRRSPRFGNTSDGGQWPATYASQGCGEGEKKRETADLAKA